MREAKQMGAQKRVGVHEGGVNGREEEVGDLVLGSIREIGWVGTAREREEVTWLKGDGDE